LKNKLFFNIVHTVILLCLLWIGIDVIRALDTIVEDRTMRITEVHHKTWIEDYWGTLPFTRDTRIIIRKEIPNEDVRE